MLEQLRTIPVCVRLLCPHPLSLPTPHLSLSSSSCRKYIICKHYQVQAVFTVTSANAITHVKNVNKNSISTSQDRHIVEFCRWTVCRQTQRWNSQLQPKPCPWLWEMRPCSSSPISKLKSTKLVSFHRQYTCRMASHPMLLLHYFDSRCSSRFFTPENKYKPL